MSRIAALRSLILKAKHAYYYSGEPIMSDAQYDALEDELRAHAPEDPVLALVGAAVPADSMLTKARHSIPMGSQSKVNSEAEFQVWWERNGVASVQASLKADGASAAAYYRDGRLVQAISRGDGLVGEDITANALRFKGLPAWVADNDHDVGFTGAVRFEVILTLQDWRGIDPLRAKNPRNVGNGIMGRKNGHQADCLTVFAFDLDETQGVVSRQFASESEKIARLIELGFSVIPHRACDSAQAVIEYFRQVVATREDLPFWIDGVVLKIDDLAQQQAMGVTSGRPKGQIAWKFDSSGAETVLQDVVVSGGHTGGLYPTAVLQPVEIGGTTVSSASLANYDEINRLDVAMGDSVWVVKANDIIPKIIRVTDRPSGRRAITPPLSCPFCSGEVGRKRTSGGDDGVIIECRNVECPKKSSGKIRRWIASLDILGIGDGVLEALLERFELEDAAGLYELGSREEELCELIINAERSIRLGRRRARSILRGIDATRSLSIDRFLGSLGLDYLGKRRVELMRRAAGGALDTLDDWRSGKLRDPEFAALAGVPNVGVAMQDGIDAMASVMDRLLAAGVEVIAPQQDVPESVGADMRHELDGEVLPTVCISGKLPSGRKKSDYSSLLLDAGYRLVDEVVTGLDLLVLAEPDSTSSKAQRARKLGVRILSEDALISLLHERSAPLDSPSVDSFATPQPPKQDTHIMTYPASGHSILRRFEFVDSASSKFWEIHVDADSTVVRYGRIGATGQTQVKAHGDVEAATKAADKLIAEKLKGGYREVDGPAGTVAQAPRLTEPAAGKSSAKGDAPAKVAKTAAAPGKLDAPPSTGAAKTLCISGKLPSGRKKADYEGPLRAVAIELVDDVVKGLAYLVLADPDSTSSKAVKARAMGVRIISEDELMSLAGMTED